MSDDHLIALANQLRVLEASPREFLIRAGATDDSSLYIIRGKVSMTAADGKSKVINFDENRELNPVARLRPCIYDIKALGPVSYLKIDNQKLKEILQLQDEAAIDISLHSLFTDFSDEDNSIVSHLYRNLMDNTIKLPQLPSVAARTQKIYRGSSTDEAAMAKLLATYPDISRKIINVARCAKRSDLSTREKISYSIQHLGILAVYCLIMVYAVGKLVNRLSPEHFASVSSFWDHCLNVAAISRILAKHNRSFSPDLAMLAGLIHGIGVLIIDDRLLQQQRLMLDHLEVDHAIQIMRPEISSLLLRKWDFDDDLIRVAEDCGNWSRQHDGPPDLCDLILAANYYGIMQGDRNHSLPKISAVPAIEKLGITATQSINAIRESATVKRNIKKLFV